MRVFLFLLLLIFPARAEQQLQNGLNLSVYVLPREPTTFESIRYPGGALIAEIPYARNDFSGEWVSSLRFMQDVSPLRVGLHWTGYLRVEHEGVYTLQAALRGQQFEAAQNPTPQIAAEVSLNNQTIIRAFGQRQWARTCLLCAGGSTGYVYKPLATAPDPASFNLKAGDYKLEIWLASHGAPIEGVRLDIGLKSPESRVIRPIPLEYLYYE